MTRLLARELAPAHIVATEVDRIQLKKNLSITDLPTDTFRYGGAESIADADETYDAVFMFKSLHHVPMDLMAQALGEIHRVLKPGGKAYFSEPVYWGPFNDLLRLVHDECEVREAAFAALTHAVEWGRFDLEAEVSLRCRTATRAGRCSKTASSRSGPHGARHRFRALRGDPAGILEHLTPTGAYFLKPHRTDLFP